MNPERERIDGEGGLAVPQEFEQQRRADQYFGKESAYWKAIYTGTDLMSRIYQLRRSVVLEMVDSLHLPPSARILEVGCGAGLTSVELAKRGFMVDAVDTVEEMLDLARHHAGEANLTGRIRVDHGDVYHLRFPDGAFDLVVAVGVIPWLHLPRPAIREMARVTRTGGSILLTADNKWRMNHVLDPRFTPLFNPIKRALKNCLELAGVPRTSHQGARVYMYSVRQINTMISEEQLSHMNGVTLGFGPFSFLNRILFPDHLGVRIHRTLQQAADRGFPAVRSMGSHYVVLMQK